MSLNCKLDQYTVNIQKSVASTGIEPATFALLARRSNQLS